MVLQTSLNIPLPSTNGQLLIGNSTTGLPSIQTLTEGSGINIDNTSIPGNIIISANKNITWNHTTTTAIAIYPFNAYVNQLTTSCLFNFTNDVGNFGDIYICASNTNAVFSVQAFISQPIKYNGTTGVVLTSTSPNAVVKLVCTNYNGNNSFLVTDVVGTFTLT